jgi:hypothetical protein
MFCGLLCPKNVEDDGCSRQLFSVNSGTLNKIHQHAAHIEEECQGKARKTTKEAKAEEEEAVSQGAATEANLKADNKICNHCDRPTELSMIYMNINDLHEHLSMSTVCVEYSRYESHDSMIPAIKPPRSLCSWSFSTNTSCLTTLSTPYL